MMKTKNIYKMYPAWEFDQEIRDLEKQSQKGWHLVKVGLFRCKFAFDDTIQYRYALDFNPNITDPMHYRETFAEQNWEFVSSTFNGWHYFRKAYDPSLSEEEYQIYTDTASLQEMANRWKLIAYILGGIELVLGLLILVMNFSHPAINSICLALGSIWLGTLLLLSTRWIGQSGRRRYPIQMLIPVLTLYIVSAVFGFLRINGFNTQTEYIVPEDDSAWQIRFDVKMPDIYTLAVNVDTPIPANVSVIKGPHDDGSPDWVYDTFPCYFTAEGTQIEQTVRMFLPPGSYVIYTKYLPGAEPGQSGEFRYELN